MIDRAQADLAEPSAAPSEQVPSEEVPPEDALAETSPERPGPADQEHGGASEPGTPDEADDHAPMPASGDGGPPPLSPTAPPRLPRPPQPSWQAEWFAGASGYLVRLTVVVVALGLLGAGAYGIRTLADPRTIQTLAGGYQEQLPPDAPVLVPSEVQPLQLVQQPQAAITPYPAAPPAVPGAAPAAGGSGRQELFADWAAGLATKLDIPQRALQAYAYAHAALQEAQPGCQLTWVTLAGIGRIESDHGRYGGATLGPDGRPSSPIIGVPLDGTAGNRAISDTDGGGLDGDNRLDRAVGPMQFIPSTWARWASDGDGDGLGDPQDIDDAAVAAGRYLCANNRDLATGPGWSRAILSYNNSQVYLLNVFSNAERYARLSV